MKKTLFKKMNFCNTAFIFVISVMLLTCIFSIQPAHAANSWWPFAANGNPVGVDGRVLTKQKTGDSSEWVEIARDGRYSLIVRKSFIDVFPLAANNGLPQWQTLTYGANSDYTKSLVRDAINDWFNNRAVGDGTKLPNNARLRDYTMYNYDTMYKRVGSTGTTQSLLDGLSKPTAYQVGVGDDIAFALSYGEAVNFCSETYFIRDPYAVKNSNATACTNFVKVSIPIGYGMWLRSFGDMGNYTAAALHKSSGFAFQYNTTSKMLVFPAAWVDSDIFGDAPKRTNLELKKIDAVNGRTLKSNRTGDTGADWIEIATIKDNSGKVHYSLIVRSKFINVYETGYRDDPSWQRTDYSDYSLLQQYQNTYTYSILRNKINRWYNSEEFGTIDVLAKDARIRNFVVYSNAKREVGSSCEDSSVTSGLSIPTFYKKGVGEDAAFALSFGETASFCSMYRFRRRDEANVPSSSIATANYLKLKLPGGNYFGMWLRSPGDRGTYTAAAMTNDKNAFLCDGRVFQFIVSAVGIGNVYTEYGLVYPAVWVGQGIFEDDPSVTYYPNGGAGNITTESVNYGEQYTIRSPGSKDLNFSKDGYNFMFWSDHPEEEGNNEYYNPGESVLIEGPLKLYAHWESMSNKVTYYPNKGTEKAITDNVTMGEMYTIRDKAFTIDGYSIVEWNTKADGSGKRYLPGEKTMLTNSLELYAQWKPNSHTITYYPNKGVVSPITDNVVFDQVYTIRENAFNVDGYKIVEWNTKADGTGTSYLPAQKITIKGTVVLYAQWKPNSLTITYYPNKGAGSPITDNVVFDQDYTIRDKVFTIGGYSIIEWNTKADGTGKRYLPGEKIKINDSVALFAQWQPDSHTITYYPNKGDSGAITDNVVFDEYYSIRDKAFTEEGYTIIRWNTKPDGSGTTYFPGQIFKITDSIELYAQWQPNSYAVMYHPNTGIGDIKTEVIKHDDKYIILSQAYSKEGHSFVGWNSEQNGSGKTYLPGEEVIVKGAIILFAQWKSDNLNIIYYPNKGVSGAIVDNVTFGQEYTILEKAFNIDGYSIVEWNTKADGSGKRYLPGEKITINGSVELYAQWKPDSHTITYYPNKGAVSPITDNVVFDQDYTIRENAFNIDGYKIVSWNTKADGSGISYSPAQKITIKGSVTLYAQWVPNSLTITYYPNKSAVSPITDNVVFDQDYTIREKAFTQEGYTIVEWNTKADGSGKRYLPGEKIKINGSVELFAQWKPDSHTITYYPNKSAISPITDNVVFDQDYTIRENVFTVDGYKIVSWNTKADGSGTSYSPAQKITIKGSVALYAQWVPNSLTITYYPNKSAVSPITDNVVFDQDYTIRDKAFTQDGYTIVEWNTKADGSGKRYLPGEKIKINGSVELFAQWKPDSHTITYYPNKSAVSPITDNVVFDQSYTIRENAFNIDGYKIVSWNTKADGTGTSYSPAQKITIKGSVTLYAQWIPDSLTITYYPNKSAVSPITDNVVFDQDYTIRDKAFTVDGYSIVEWNTKADGSGIRYLPGEKIKINGSVALYAQWKPDSHTITYYPNKSAVSPITDNVEFDQVYTIREDAFTIDGYKIASWNTKADGTGTSYSPAQKIVIKGTVALYAQWIPDAHTITYYPNKGVGGEITDNVVFDQDYTIRENAYNIDGYKIVSWNTKADGSGTSYLPAQKITIKGSIELYAQWSQNNLTVTYYPNFGANMPDTDNEASSGSPYTVKDMGYTRDLFLFDGWNTRSDGLGTNYSINQVIPSLTTDLTLYAKWIIKI